MSNNKTRTKKESSELHESTKGLFATLGLRFNMASFRFCANNNLDVANLAYFSPKNLLDLILIGVRDNDPKEAEMVIDKWLESGNSLQLLHVYCLELAKSSGFFTTQKDLDIMGAMVDKDKEMLQTVLPTATRGVQGMKEALEGLEKSLT